MKVIEFHVITDLPSVCYSDSAPDMHSCFILSFSFFFYVYVLAFLYTFYDNNHVFSEASWKVSLGEEEQKEEGHVLLVSTICSSLSWLLPVQAAQASEVVKANAVYEVGELFELGIQLSYLLLLLALLGVGSFYVIRQVLVRRELDLSAKELQVSTSTKLFCCIFLRIIEKSSLKVLVRVVKSIS